MTVEPLRREDWLALIGSPSALPVTPFQHPDWLDHQIRTIPGAATASLLFRFDDGLSAAVPLIRVRSGLWPGSSWSLGHDEYGGILSRDPLASAHVEAILRNLSTRRPIRVTFPPGGFVTADRPLPHPWQRDAQSTHVLTLPADYETWFTQRVSKTCRTDLRRAEKSGLSIAVGGSTAAIDHYFQLHELSAGRWHQPGAARKKSRDDFARLLACPLTQLSIVYKGVQPAAGLITVEWGTSVMYYLGASDRQFAESRPTDFGIAELVRRSIANGRHTLNFGGSLGQNSLERFKEKFGAIKTSYATLFVNDLRTSLLRSYRYYRSRFGRLGRR